MATLLPNWKQDRTLDLVPKRWAKTREHPDMQKCLAELRLLDRA